MKNLIYVTAIAFITLFASCSKETKKRGLDYDKLKQELALTPEQTTKFDELAAKFKKMGEENKAANTTEGGEMNRIAFFTKMEEIYNQQNQEFAQFLDEAQLAKYTAFMDQNTRKRPRYNDELLTKIKTELALNEEQSKVLEAANNAFEKEFQDAHDIYHGNNELAAEYWNKFNDQRTAAIEKVLTPEQITQFKELIKEVKSPSEK